MSEGGDGYCSITSILPTSIIKKALHIFEEEMTRENKLRKCAGGEMTMIIIPSSS